MADDEDDDEVVPAKTFEELPLHVRKFFTSLKRDDIRLLRGGMEFTRWFRTTGKFTKAVVLGGFSVFAMMVGAAQGWDYVVLKFFTKAAP